MIDDKSQIEDIFSESWRQVQAGRSIEYVLADYPEYAAQLEPTLRLDVRLRALSTLQPSPDSFSRIQQRTRSAMGVHFSVSAEIAEPGKASEPPQRSQAQTGDEKVAPLYRRWLTPL